MMLLRIIKIPFFMFTLPFRIFKIFVNLVSGNEGVKTKGNVGVFQRLVNISLQIPGFLMEIALLWVDALSAWTTLVLNSLFGRVKNIVVQTLMIVCVFLVLLWIAIFMYGSFYYTYMPSVSHISDINLQFSNCRMDELDCKYPHANLTLVTGNQGELMMRGQPYVVSVDLLVPESKVNQEIGNFMVVLQFYSRHGEIVRQASRASLLRYKSFILRTFQTLFFLPLYVIGSSQQEQVLPVTIFTNYVEDPYRATMGAYVEVQNRFIEIYESKLRIHARFSGLRYVLYNYPLTSALFGVSINMVFLGTLALLSWYNFRVKGTEDDISERLLVDQRRRRIQRMIAREQEELKAKEKAKVIEEDGDSSSQPESLQAMNLLKKQMEAEYPEDFEDLDGEDTSLLSAKKTSVRQRLVHKD